MIKLLKQTAIDLNPICSKVLTLPCQLCQRWSLLQRDQKRRLLNRAKPGPDSLQPWELQRTPENHVKATSKLIFCQRIWTVWCYDYTYLNQTSRRELLGVNDQLGPVPKGQSIAKKNDAPQVSLENSNDGAFFYTPALSFCKVFVIPVKNVHVICTGGGMKHPQLQRSGKLWTPVGFFRLPSKRSHCSDRWEDFISHTPCLCVGLQLAARQSPHSLQQQVPNTD